MSTSFFAPGVPQPQGSKVPAIDSNGKPFMRESCKGLPAWRKVVAQAAGYAHRGAPLDGPIRLAVTFYLERPKTHMLPSGELSAKGKRHDYPDTKPDWDKLARAVGDSLTDARVIADDARIVDAHIRELWSETEPGARILVEAMPPIEKRLPF